MKHFLVKFLYVEKEVLFKKKFSNIVAIKKFFPFQDFFEKISIFFI